MLLATDLDGTFLGGRQSDRMRLYRFLPRQPEVTLVFVTGRGFEHVVPLIYDPTIPTPKYVICDVGTTIVHGDTLEPVQPIQSDINQAWPGEPAVLEAIEGIDGLERQEVPQQRRCSFFVPPGYDPQPVRDAVEPLGCEVLHSADKYLDILPAGVNKGTTLMKLVELIGMDPARVLVAGDTLNDLPMFETGYKGVVVGAAEQRLVDATQRMSQVYHSEASGAGAILDAFSYFQFLGPKAIEDLTRAQQERGSSQLIMVYHRLPYEEHMVDGKLVHRRPKSPNGIMPSLLSLFEGGRTGMWIAWSQQDTRNPEEFQDHTMVDEEAYPELLVSRVPLTSQDVQRFYKTFSKEALWPTIHTFIERTRFNHDDWQHYVEINRIFAERTAAEADEGAVIWIHDYNLWMVPAHLRKLRPDLRIAFFHHTYFPSSEIFNVIPWRRQIVGSLLQCDYVGFHIPRHLENFVDVVRSNFPVEVLERQNCAPRFLTYDCALGLDEMTTGIKVSEDHVVHMGAHPIGVSANRIRKLVESEQVQQRMAGLREELQGKRVVLSVERLDYTKGPLAKLEAFERLLEENPELHGKVTFVDIVTPAARGMKIYEEIQQQVEYAVGRINGRFAKLDWTPVRFFFRSMPFEDVLAYYAVADVGWITPLRDGLNLVAKEYAAVQGLTHGKGVLVLSEFAGAAVELEGAIRTNPYDEVDMMHQLYRALTLGDAERRDRIAQMADVVMHHDLETWGQDFIQAVKTAAKRRQRIINDPSTKMARVYAAHAVATSDKSRYTPA